MILLILFTFLAIFLFHELYWKRRKYPPGPMPIPLFGNLLHIFMNPPGYSSFWKWRQEYGPVYTYWMTTMPVVAICDYETLKESLVKDGENFIERDFMQNFNEILRGGNYGLTSATGDLWRDQRRFTLHTMRDFGMGRNIMEERVMVEVDFLLDRLEQLKDNVHMQKEFDTAVGSVINNILFGYRFDEANQHEFELVKNALREMIKAGSNVPFLVTALVPCMRNLPFFRGELAKVLSSFNVLFDFLNNQIEERRKHVDMESETSSDFVEAYLKEREARKGTPSEDFYSDVQLRNLLFDMWGAGMETTSNTLTWAVCYLLNYPEWQDRIHEELDRVIRSERRVTMADKTSLPYLSATICEVQRTANILAQSLIRQTIRDTVLNGHKIPAGTAVMPQIATVLYDETVFPDPYTFDPNRFLNPDGSVRNFDELIPFSMGKRQCIGEGLAKMELYLFLANILQKFKITSDKKPSMEKITGQIVTAKPYQCHFTLRNQ